METQEGKELKIAVVSTAAEQVALNNVAVPCGWKWFAAQDLGGVAEYNPDILFIGGWYVDNYEDFWLYKAVVGECKHVIVHWWGTDTVLCRKFHETGQRSMFEWLKQDRFLNIPCSEQIRTEVEEWFGIEMVSPVVVPVEKIYQEIPKPERFTIGVYMPGYRLDFYNYNLLASVLPESGAKVIFYHWLPLHGQFPPYSGPYSLRYGLSRKEYEDTIAECSCAVRIPIHDGMSCGSAEFLMAGRPVISQHDMPGWSARIRFQPGDPRFPDRDKPGLLKAIEKVKNGDGNVPVKVQDEFRRMFDPALFKQSILALANEKWGL